MKGNKTLIIVALVLLLVLALLVVKKVLEKRQSAPPAPKPQDGTITLDSHNRLNPGGGVKLDPNAPVFTTMPVTVPEAGRLLPVLREVVKPAVQPDVIAFNPHTPTVLEQAGKIAVIRQQPLVLPLIQSTLTNRRFD